MAEFNFIAASKDDSDGYQKYIYFENISDLEEIVFHAMKSASRLFGGRCYYDFDIYDINGLKVDEDELENIIYEIIDKFCKKYDRKEFFKGIY